MKDIEFFLKQANVLIICDSLNIINTLTEILKQKGYNKIKNTILFCF
jgi:hypothetical protein